MWLTLRIWLYFSFIFLWYDYILYFRQVLEFGVFLGIEYFQDLNWFSFLFLYFLYSSIIYLPSNLSDLENTNYSETSLSFSIQYNVEYSKYKIYGIAIIFLLLTC